MQQHILDWYNSRGIDISTAYTPCEWIGCGANGTEKHHITSSYRGARKHQKDGSDIINVCKHHHDYIHAHNNYDMRTQLLERVKFILKKVRDAKDKD